MPKLLDRVAKSIQRRGAGKYTRSDSYAIANAALHKAGHLRKGSLKLTKKGRRQSRRRHRG